MKVVIPSAKIVPRELQNLGRLPAIIYPVGQGIVFDYLLEQYEEQADRAAKMLVAALSVRQKGGAA